MRIVLCTDINASCIYRVRIMWAVRNAWKLQWTCVKECMEITMNLCWENQDGNYVFAWWKCVCENVRSSLILQSREFANIYKNGEKNHKVEIIICSSEIWRYEPQNQLKAKGCGCFWGVRNGRLCFYNEPHRTVLLKLSVTLTKKKSH